MVSGVCIPMLTYASIYPAEQIYTPLRLNQYMLHWTERTRRYPKCSGLVSLLVNCMAYKIKNINLHYGKFKIPHDNKFSAYFEDQFDICLSSLSYFDNFRMPFTYISLHNLPLLPIRCEKATELLVNAGLYHESQTMCCTDPYIPWWQHHTF